MYLSSKIHSHFRKRSEVDVLILQFGKKCKARCLSHVPFIWLNNMFPADFFAVALYMYNLVWMIIILRFVCIVFLYIPTESDISMLNNFWLS